MPDSGYGAPCWLISNLFSSFPLSLSLSSIFVHFCSFSRKFISLAAKICLQRRRRRIFRIRLRLRLRVAHQRLLPILLLSRYSIWRHKSSVLGCAKKMCPVWKFPPPVGPGWARQSDLPKHRPISQFRKVLAQFSELSAIYIATEFPIPSCIEVFRKSFRELPG